jgi:hypothetical protein
MHSTTAAGAGPARQPDQCELLADVGRTATSDRDLAPVGQEDARGGSRGLGDGRDTGFSQRGPDQAGDR